MSSDTAQPHFAKRAYRTILSPDQRKWLSDLRADLRFRGRMLREVRDPTVRRMQRRLSELRGSYSGQRCFVMGNGPSLNKMELDRFEGEHVWGSNRCYLLFDRISWRPSFYTAVDQRVVPDTAEEIGALQRELRGTSFFFPIHYRFRGVLSSTPNTYWYRQIPLSEGANPRTSFSTDATNGVRSVRSVTVAAMQLAVHLGFNPIYLIGCDTSYTIPETVHHDEGNADLLVSTRDDDLNHFDPRYFGAGRRWHEPHVDRMIDHYRHAKAVCDAHGVQIFNATVGGRLEIFPRVDYRDL